MKKFLIPTLLIAMFVTLACEKESLQPAGFSDTEIEFRSDNDNDGSGENCFNFQTSTEGCVYWGQYVWHEGVPLIGFGTLPIQIGEYDMYLAGGIISQEFNGNGSYHNELLHKFWDDEGNSFFTLDQGPAVVIDPGGIEHGPDWYFTKINIHGNIVSGTGDFENATGRVSMHYILSSCFEECGWGSCVETKNIHGRICLNQ